MKSSKIALKPFIDQISRYCDVLSREELIDLLLRVAQTIPPSQRPLFLSRIKAALPDSVRVAPVAPDEIAGIIEDIQALQECIAERIDSIEDGTYYDDPDHWDDYGGYDDDIEYLSEDQVEELKSCFNAAASLFLDKRLKEVHHVYTALFDLVRFIDERAFYSLSHEIDLREARAQYCRCVFETTKPHQRMDEFIRAMEIDI